MTIFELQVQSDYIQRLATGRKPSLALVELIWNSLDADARNVAIGFERDLTGTIQSISVEDDGTGISEADAEAGFSRLGGSWKSVNSLTRRDRRALHGKEGKGRLHVFALGDVASWVSVTEALGKKRQVAITTSVDNPRRVDISSTVVPANTALGTTVAIREVHERSESLTSLETREEISEILATYLRQYPVGITLDGKSIDPSSHITIEQSYDVMPFDADGELVDDLHVTVVEWSIHTSKTLYLCGPDGFALHSVKSGVQAPDFNFTAYARSAYVKRLYDTNELFIGDTHLGLIALQDACRRVVRDHIRARVAERAADLVEEWKQERIYPYEGEPANVLERTERQVFDIVAHSVNLHLTTFATSDTKTKQFSFQLLRQALENNPESLERIFTDVLGLPRQKQDELAELLGGTSLSNIISASKLVTDRLNFLKALDCMLFEEDSKRELLERRQLHRMLADHAWVFGEQYHLSIDDESLTRVLQKHVKYLGRETINPDVSRGRKGKAKAVKRVDGTDGIIDIMMSRAITRGSDLEREHLVIELKRPTQPVNQEVINQITSYALAVANDERFLDTKTKWHFIAISNELDAVARARSRQVHRPRGLIDELESDAGQPISIWVKTWAEVLEENRARHDFFQRQLSYQVSRESALASVRRTHEKYFPATLLKADSA